MFFGMSNSPPTFQRFMNGLLEKLYHHFEKKGVYNIRKIFHSYMDDTALGTKLKDIELHKEILHFLFNLFTENRLHLKLSKSVFIQPSIDFLGVHISKDGTTINPAKVAGIAEWPEEITTLKGACSIIGVIGYHQMFIPGFSMIAAPITKLFGKDVPFIWSQECKDTLRELKQRVTTAPALVQPDPSKQFELEVDASQIVTGAILYQRGPPGIRPDRTNKPGTHHPVGFHSQKFSTTEQNYPIYNREFLAIMRGLRNWDYLLKGTTTPVLVYTDHANLCYYHDPQKIGLHIARYLPEHKQYNILLEYKSGMTNRADGLLHREDYDTGSNPDNEDITVWPDQYFCKQHMTIHVTDWDLLEDNLNMAIHQAQWSNQATIKRWASAHNLTSQDGTHRHRGTTLVVVADKLRRGVTSLFHDQITTGHPGITKTLQLLMPYYWWPNIKTFVTEYIHGCVTCQMNKVNTHPTHPLLSPITPEENARPFKTIAMDFITKLPSLGEYNTILMITDMDCSKASIFLPCKEAINSEGVMQLYLTHVLC